MSRSQRSAIKAESIPQSIFVLGIHSRRDAIHSVGIQPKRAVEYSLVATSTGVRPWDPPITIVVDLRVEEHGIQGNRSNHGWHDRQPVHLKLEERLSVPPVPYHCLSWRTFYPGGQTNRQYYRLRGSGFWTIPIPLALELMRQADDHGWLDGAYHDPLFVVIQIPDNKRRWRNIMIIDSERNLSTFRSTTTDRSYKAVVADPVLSP